MVLLCKTLNDLPRVVTSTVLNEEDLKSGAVFLKNRDHPPIQLRETFFGSIDGYDKRDHVFEVLEILQRILFPQFVVSNLTGLDLKTEISI